MAKHFTKACIVNGYAGMGNSMARPRFASPAGRSVAESIARARRVAANEAKAKKSK